jgi:hypothetical protein
MEENRLVELEINLRNDNLDRLLYLPEHCRPHQEPVHDEVDDVQGDIIDDLNFLFGDLFLGGNNIDNIYNDNNNGNNNDNELEFLFRELRFNNNG